MYGLSSTQCRSHLLLRQILHDSTFGYRWLVGGPSLVHAYSFVLIVHATTLSASKRIASTTAVVLVALLVSGGHPSTGENAERAAALREFAPFFVIFLQKPATLCAHGGCRYASAQPGSRKQHFWSERLLGDAGGPTNRDGQRLAVIATGVAVLPRRKIATQARQALPMRKAMQVAAQWAGMAA